MATVGEMLVALGINTGPFTAGLAKAQGELRGFAAEADATGGRASSALQNVGIASLVVVGGVAAIGAGAVDMAAKYQEAMTTVQINAHLSETATQAIGTAIAQTAIGTEASSTTMAAALGPVAGELQRIAGGTLTAAAATQVLTAAQDLSEASTTDLTTTVKSLTDLMLVYHQGTDAAAADADLLQAAHAQLGVGVDVLSGQLQRLQPKLAGSGVDMATLLGVARELEPVVGTGQRAVLTMGTVLQAFSEPSASATKALGKIGVTLTDVHGKFIGFGPAITAINAALAKTGPAQKAAELQAIFGKNVGIVTALLKGGAAGIAANVKALTDQGTAAAAAALRSKELGDQLGTFRASAATAVTALGGALLPAVNQLMAAVLPVINGFAQWAAANPQLAATILAVVGGVAALVAGVAFLGPILGAIGGIIATITNPILLVVGAITALAAHFGLLGKGAKDAVDGIIATITSAIPGVISMLGNLASQALAWVGAQAPIFLAQLLSWADAFVGWIGPMVPVALAALADFGASLVRWVIDEVPILATGIAMLAGQFVNWILPKIPGLLADLGQFGLALVNWIATEATVVAGAFADLAIWAIGSLGSALVSDPSLIVKGIALLLGGVLVVAAAQAAATVVGTAYTVALKIAAAAAGVIGDFAAAIGSAILTKLTTMAAAGGIVGTAIGAAMKIGALAAEGFGNIGAAIAGVIGEATPAVTVAAQTQGAVAGAAGAVSFGAALAVGLAAAAAAAVVAAWAIINNGLNAQVNAVQTRLTEVIGQQNLTQLNIDKSAIGTGIANIMSIPFGETLYGDQLKSLRAQMAQVDDQIARVKAAASSAPSGPNWSSGHDVGLVAVPDITPKLTAVPDITPKLTAVPEPAALSLGQQLLAAGMPKQTLIDAGLLPGTKTPVPKVTLPSAAALATAPVTAATSAAAQATTAAQIHLESMRVQLQTAELAANAGDAAAAQQVLVLKAEIAHQQAADAVAAAQRAVTVAETTVKASHDKLVLAQDKLALATAKLTLAQGSAALQAQAAVTKAAAAAPGNPLGFLEPAGGITGAGGAVGMIFGSTTASTVSASSAGASGYAIDWAALKEVAAAFRQAISSGVPLTLDGQTVGDLVSQHAYVSASMATSGFVAQGSIG